MSALVSAIIPTHDYGRFVARAVESVLAQTYSPIECIVVDDGSTDDTRQVLAGYGDRIRAIHQVNRGPSAARNNGIAAARGRYVGFLDADDVWKPRKIERQVEMLEADAEMGAVGCGVDLVEEGGPPRAVLARPVTKQLPDRLRRIAVRDSWVEGSASGALIPRGVLDAVGSFDEELRAAEDWDLWLRIAARYRIGNVPEVLLTIFRHGTGSFRNAEKVEHFQWKVYQAAVARWPDLLDDRTRRRMRALIHADAGGEYRFAGRHDEALRRYLASLREWPLDALRWNIAARLWLRRFRA
jgi:glycosyltransferase involved in cell wall biosynthesis